MDGSWAGAATGEISALSQLVLLYAFLGREGEELVEQSALAILRQQRAAGGWSRMPGGVFDLNVSVQAYFALKVVGEDGCGMEMARARRAIREHGGADRCDESTRRWLALLGQIDYDLCRPLMPEWLLTTALNQQASSREAIDLSAQAVVWALRARRGMALSRGVRELFVERPQDWMPAARETQGGGVRFAGLWSRCERAGFVPFRRRALERARFLLSEAAAESPPAQIEFEELAWQWIALSALGFRKSSRAIQSCERRLAGLIAIDDSADEARSWPTTTLSIDTSLALAALTASGLRHEHAIVSAGVRWILEHRAAAVEAGPRTPEMAALLRALTAIELARDFDGVSLPPELRVLDHVEHASEAGDAMEMVPTATLRQFVDRLVSGLSIEQRPDGGWVGDWAGDGTRYGGQSRLRVTGINHVSGRRWGPSTAEMTGAVLESISSGGICVRAASSRAIASLRTSQRGDGSWDSATHARYVHGTSCAIRGLIAAGVNANDPSVAQGVNWLLVHQDESGGWGEAAGDAVDRDEFVPAEATSIQTAWAVLALVAAGRADHDAARRGVSFLVESQGEDGGWCDAALVERDAPNGPWFANQLHATSWSLLALAKWAVAIADQSPESGTSLRLLCGDSAR